MGFSKAHNDPPRDAIVILQWLNCPTEPSPRRRFWILQQRQHQPGSDEGGPGALPVPTVVDDRFSDSARKGRELPNERPGDLTCQFPPVLTHYSRWNSIQMHTLTMDKHINSETTLWGPGIRLNHVQVMEKVFDIAPPPPLDTRSFPLAAVVNLNGNLDIDDYGDTCALYLGAVAMHNGDGTATIKYRAQYDSRSRRSSNTMDALHVAQEQTLRVAFECEPCLTVTQKRITPVYQLSIGSRPRYVVLMTLCPAVDDEANILSIHTIDERIIVSEASLTTEPNKDRGFRWQVQTFRTSRQALRVAPVAMMVDGSAHLFFFYFQRGDLRYAQLKYAGSGSFTEFTDGHRCAFKSSAAPTTERAAAGSAPRSSWSLSSLVQRSSREHETETQTSLVDQEGAAETSACPADRCQPYAVKANGYLWIFYEGHGGNGRYLRRKMPRRGDEIVSADWETTHWDASAMDAENHDHSHFIPVVVAANFMSM